MGLTLNLVLSLIKHLVPLSHPHLLLDVSGMGKHTQQRRRIVVTLLSFLPVSILILMFFSPPRIFTRSLDSYITSGIPWKGDGNNNNSRTPCWKAAPALYNCFRDSVSGSADNPLRPASDMEALIVPTQPLHPSHCIDDFLTNAKPCSAPHLTTLDVVWTWVNGSDALFQQALWDATDSLSTQRQKNPRPGKLYRSACHVLRDSPLHWLTTIHSDHDELKHSIRSVLQHFGGHTTQFHLVAADMPHPDNRNPFRLGLMPQWLNSDAMGHWKHGHISLALQHHSQLFIGPGRPSFNR